MVIFHSKKSFLFLSFSLLLPDNNRYQQMSNTRMQRPGARDWTLHSPQEVKKLNQILIFSFDSFNSFYLIAPSVFCLYFLCIDSGRLCSLSGCPRKDKVTPESKQKSYSNEMEERGRLCPTQSRMMISTISHRFVTKTLLFFFAERTAQSPLSLLVDDQLFPIPTLEDIYCERDKEEEGVCFSCCSSVQIYI